MEKINKVIFFANKSPPYRIPFFNGLSKKINVKFIFTHENEKIEGAKFNYELTRGLGYKKYRIHESLIEILDKEKPSNVVLLPLDPLHLIDNMLIYKYCKKNNIDYFIWNERWHYKNIPLKDKISLKFYRRVIKGAKGFFVSGKKSEEFIKSFCIEKEKIFFSPDASEIKYNEKEVNNHKKELINKYQLKDKKIILYVGRLIKRKGIQYLIQAFSKINGKNVVLIIVGGDDFYNLGEPSFKKELIKIVRKNRLEQRILFTGEIKRKILPEVYLLADVLVVPSITDKIGEPWGLVLNEGMQFGCPVIATDAVGAAHDLIKNGKNGYIISEKDPEELRKSIEKILKNERMRKNMGRNSRKVIKERYNYGKMIKGFLNGLK